jgi:alkylation response protein AidB-like acyl-CoA dehydrogenase
MATIAPGSVLSDELIARCGERAASYDRENRFFHEDFEELRAAGYLKMAVPRDFGGLGMTLAQVCQEQKRLAYRAPATALATNMHLYWTGVAASLLTMGDESLKWVLEEAAAGEVFAAGHGESGNDYPVLYSTARAERVDGGYRFYGRKLFGSLGPVWTRLGLHAQDNSDPSNPVVVHAFLPRDTEGYHIEETWDTLGMRATRSDDTVLEGAFVPDRYVVRVLPAGLAGADLFIVALFGWVEPTFGHIYLGLARRALDLAIASVKTKTSLAQLTRTMAYHPGVQHHVSEMVLALEAAEAHVERIAEDWSNGVDHGGAWPAKLIAAKYNAVEAAQKVVDLAMELSGGAGLFKRNELERLYRDVRAGRIHPANGMLVHEFVGKTYLGVLGDGARWG